MFESIDFSNIKFWVAFQMAVDLVMVFLVIYFLKTMKSGSFRDAGQVASGRVFEIMEPLLRDADATAKSFETQLKEKKRLINRLNESLDGRIISLNLLLNRSDALFRPNSRTIDSGSDGGGEHVVDLQEAILAAFNKGQDAATTARELSIPPKEVELVYGLKQKFLKLEKELTHTDPS